MLRNSFLVFFVPAAIILGAGIGAALLVFSAPITPQVPERSEPIAVRVLEARPEKVRLRVPSQGVAAPLAVASLVPEVSGRITWISPSFVPGGEFEAGELLLQLDDEDYHSTVRRRSAALDRAAAEDELARQELARQQELVRNNLISQAKLESSLRTQRIAEANLTDALLALSEARRSLARSSLKAPFAGVVRSESVDLGQFVSRGQKVAELYGRDFVEVRLPLADSQLAYLTLPTGNRGDIPGARRPKVKLSADYAGQNFIWQGEVVRMEAELDARTRMVHLVARVANNLPLTPPVPIGLFVHASIEGREVSNLVALPRAAIRNNEQVLVVDGENRLRLRRVSLFRLEQDRVLIDGGLSAGERVCISPLRTVVDGMPVIPVLDDLAG